MSIETKKKTIDDLDFEVTQFPARRALMFQRRVIRVIGPLLATGVGSFKDMKAGLLNASIDGDALGRGVQRALDTLSDTEYIDLILDSFSMTKVNGTLIDRPEAFDNAFNGKTSAIFKGFAFVWEANFGPLPFIGSIRERVETAMSEIGSNAFGE